MKTSILEGKQILAVNDDPEVLEVLQQKILEAGLICRFDKATTYHQAVERLLCLTYDLVVLDIKGSRSFDLLNLAVMRNFPVAMLASNPLNPDSLKRSIEMGAGAYLPKDKMSEIVPFLEDMLTCKCLPGWRRLFGKMRRFWSLLLRLNSELQIGSLWKKMGEWRIPLK